MDGSPTAKNLVSSLPRLIRQYCTNRLEIKAFQQLFLINLVFVSQLFFKNIFIRVIKTFTRSLTIIDKH